jgi:hypothetical protein
METIKKFNKRAFITVGLFMSGSILPLSGFMNHLLGNESLTTERLLWMAIHNSCGILFTIFSIWHLTLNWRPLLNYLKQAAIVFVSKEAIYAFSVILFFLALAVWHILHTHQHFI